MAKKILKRSLALGALMAFVITGSAMAAELGKQTVTSDSTIVTGTYDDLNSADVLLKRVDSSNVVVKDANIKVHNGGTLTIASACDHPWVGGGVLVNTTIESNGAVNLINSGNDATLSGIHVGTNDVTIKAKKINVTSASSWGIFLSEGGTNNFLLKADEDIVVNSLEHGIYAVSDGLLKIEGNSLKVTTTDGCAVIGQTETSNLEINANTIDLESNGKSAIVALGGGNVKINAGAISVTTHDLAGTADHKQGSIASTGNLEINVKDSLTINNDSGNDTDAIFVGDGKEMLINGVDGSKPVLDVIGNISAEGNAIVSGLNFNGKESSLTGAINTGANAPIAFNDGATWTPTPSKQSNVKDLESNGGKIAIGTDAVDIQIDTLTGDALNINTDNTDSSIDVASNQNKKITVAAGENLAANITDANQGEQLQALANVVSVEDGNKQKTVTVAAGDVNGAITAVTDNNGKIATVQEEANTTNAAVSDMASISLMTWRQENNDMNKRLGELRDSKGQHGAWARMARGESKYGAQGVKNQYNYYQVGYDEKLSTNPNWTVGVALTRTEGNSSFRDGSGENNHTGVAVYGSYLGDNGSFLDLIAKYSRMDNEYKTVGGVGDANYKTNGYSVSAEYGKRFTKENGLWIEPQIELTYGTVGSVNYLTSKDASVCQNGIDSFVGRIGFALGKNIKAGNIYARASYLYDFDGETTVTYSKGGVTRSFEQDLGGGWWEVGIGSNINLSDATHLYFDVEKTYGGDVATPWQWNVGVRYSF